MRRSKGSIRRTVWTKIIINFEVTNPIHTPIILKFNQEKLIEIKNLKSVLVKIESSTFNITSIYNTRTQGHRARSHLSNHLRPDASFSNTFTVLLERFKETNFHAAHSKLQEHCT